ncbi:helix-turn-helix domain-containing protein [Streptomyces sp. NPDC048637]|uniref:helix-turn-helix domain-containing protein n=1 Tax=Streptomyces sp. NPDC048637 TaxID=3155636 RepID=UPI003439DE96
MKDEESGNRLGSYLRARRELVSPAQAGIPPGGNRRVPGLRREEVALLAGISPDYYLRLERGRDKNPSPQVLESLARVLGLDDIERTYLLGLTAARPRAPRRKRPEHVPARVHQLLAHLQIPAFVEGRAFDVLASNPMAVALSPRLRPGQNRLRSRFLDPEEQSLSPGLGQSRRQLRRRSSHHHRGRHRQPTVRRTRRGTRTVQSAVPHPVGPTRRPQSRRRHHHRPPPRRR